MEANLPSDNHWFISSKTQYIILKDHKINKSLHKRIRSIHMNSRFSQGGG